MRIGLTVFSKLLLAALLLSSQVVMAAPARPGRSAPKATGRRVAQAGDPVAQARQLAADAQRAAADVKKARDEAVRLSKAGDAQGAKAAADVAHTAESVLNRAYGALTQLPPRPGIDSYIKTVQAARAEAQKAVSEADAAAAKPSGQASITAPVQAGLTPQDMINQGNGYITKMNEVAQRIQQALEQARRSKDIIRLNCIQDKLVQVKVNMNIATQARQSLQEALARRDEGASLHEFTRLTIVQQKIQVLDGEAQACVGEDLTFVGATRVDVEIDPAIPRTDPTLGILPLPPIERPPNRLAPASPFM